MEYKKLFLASSSELQEDRKEFELFIRRKNDHWVPKGVYLKPILWENFLDRMSKTRLQDEYNKAIRECDLFVMLFWTKVGPYTEEEFGTAFGQFQRTNKPFIFTYFKDAGITTGSADTNDLMSLQAFQEKLARLGHFQTVYKNIDGLKTHFNAQLDKLAANRFIEFEPGNDDEVPPGATRQQATLTGSGAIAQGAGDALGAGAVRIAGDNRGDVNTGTRIDTGGGAYVGGSAHADGDIVGRDKNTQGVLPAELEPLFARLLADVSNQASMVRKAAAIQKVEELKAEIAKGEKADDSRLGTIVDGLVALVPGAVASVVSLFATPILEDLVGPVTRFVLGKLKNR